MPATYQHWIARSSQVPQTFAELRDVVMSNRHFAPMETLDYGDHGLSAAAERIAHAIQDNKRIALYADYDVDGTMSCVSWVWFLHAIDYHNFVHYIPCRFNEGYGLNLQAIQHLIEEEKAEVVITMDTGITANEEAAYCHQRGVEFICTDHHQIQADKMPDCVIVNPKQHTDPHYQELCGCGITFVLLRKLGELLNPPQQIWQDLLALAGMATICDLVPLNPVNHRLARLGISALAKSQRPVLRQLLQACGGEGGTDEQDIGFRLGPRINAVGRLEHADTVIEAFLSENPEPLIAQMNRCNEERKQLQQKIVKDAKQAAMQEQAAPVLFLGGDWHPGVVGIAASNLVDEFWRPVWLFQRAGDTCKGSARSIAGFDVTQAMGAAADLFSKFGGHSAAGGFTFPAACEEQIRERLCEHAEQIRSQSPELWESRIEYDCELPKQLATIQLADLLDSLKPFGHGFTEPLFMIKSHVQRIQYYNDKATGKPRHTALTVEAGSNNGQKIVFFNRVIDDLTEGSEAEFVVSASRNVYRGVTSLSLFGKAYR